MSPLTRVSHAVLSSVSCRADLSRLPPACRLTATYVLQVVMYNFMNFFGHEIFHEIFLKYFINFTMFFSGFTLTRLTFFIRQTLPFIHLCILQLHKPICRPTCLVCLFKSSHTIDIEIFCRTKDYAGCIIRWLKIFPKSSAVYVGCTNVTDDRQTE